jgi:predicted porin
MMNKKLIAMGIAAALAVPFVAAQAGVEVYGDARMSTDYNDNGDDTGGPSANNCGTTTNDKCEKTKYSVSSNGSYIGFKGDEDLGNGLTAMYQFEQGVDWDTGSWNSSQGSRPTFVGLGTGFGTFMAGTFDTPYMTATDRYDIFADTKADYNAIIGAANVYGGIYDTRVKNTVVYATPNLSGFTGEVAYVASDILTDDSLPITKQQAKQDAYSLSGNYDNGPLSLAVAYQIANQAGLTSSSGSPDDITGYKLGGSYTILDATTIALIFENLDVGGPIKDRNAYYVNVSHKMGATTLKLAYGMADNCSGDSNVCNNTGADQVAVGASYALSKNTEVYGLYTQVSNDNNGDYSLVYGPSSVQKVDGTMSDVSSISFGINHMFSSK